MITGFFVIKCSTVELTDPTQGAIASADNVNNTRPLAISRGPGVYSVIVFNSEVVNVPSPPLLFQVKLVTLLDNAPVVVMTLPSQIVWAAPVLTIGFFCIGMRTVFVTLVLQGAFGIAVSVKSI